MPNQIYQLPNCSKMGRVRPKEEFGIHGTKVGGGSGVILTQETEIHSSSGVSQYAERRLWDAHDMPALRLMAEAVHEQCALIENLELIGDAASPELTDDAVYSGHLAALSLKEDAKVIEQALFEQIISLKG